MFDRLTTKGIKRFTKAQNSRFDDGHPRQYEVALREIRNGHKDSCWIWYVFPQLKALGKSEMALFYGIKDLDEAKNYLKDDILRGRLLEITVAACESALKYDLNAEKLFGWSVDARKFHASITLFHRAIGNERKYFLLDAAIRLALDLFFGGKEHFETLDLLGGCEMDVWDSIRMGKDKKNLRTVANILVTMQKDDVTGEFCYTGTELQKLDAIKAVYLLSDPDSDGARKKEALKVLKETVAFYERTVK